MAQILTKQVRRGTRSQLNSISLASGELGFTTDELCLYVGDGSNNYLVGRVLQGTTAPTGI